MLKMKKFLLVAVMVLWAGSSADAAFSLFAPRPAKFSILKVNSNKKYLHLMTRTRGVLGTSHWGKFNYDVIELPYEKQGEYFTITWKRTGGLKELDKDLKIQIEFKHQSGKVDKVEKIFPRSKRGRYLITFENTGDRFVDEGEIELWRVSLWVENLLVAEKESKLWWTVRQPPS